MVPQDAFLFSATLAENIAFGRPDASRAEIERAARRAQLAKDVEDLPDGYDTMVGERGVMLSGGQRQRTALARALLLDPAILILDDTLSAVDAETEAAIQRELDAVYRGRTVVVVSSRVSAVRGADQIVVLARGSHRRARPPRGAGARGRALRAARARAGARSEGAAAELALAGGAGVSARRRPAGARARARRSSRRRRSARPTTRGCCAGSGPSSRPYRRQVALTILFVVPLLVFELAPAWIVKTGLDRVIVPARDRRAGGRAAARRRCCARPAGLPPLSGSRCSISACRPRTPRFAYLDQSIMGRTGQSAMRDLRRTVFAHIQRLHIGFFDSMPVGRLVTRATNDVENVAEMFSAGIVALRARRAAHDRHRDRALPASTRGWPASPSWSCR